MEAIKIRFFLSIPTFFTLFTFFYLLLQSRFIEITVRHGYSPIKLLYIFRTLSAKNTSGGLLLYLQISLALKFTAIINLMVGNDEILDKVLYLNCNFVLILSSFVLNMFNFFSMPLFITSNIIGSTGKYK